jgi:hypothetical protein
MRGVLPDVFRIVCGLTYVIGLDIHSLLLSILEQDRQFI